MGHNVGAAAANAVKNSEKKSIVALTPEQLIQELRKNLKMVPAGYVPTHQIVALLGDFDAEKEFSHKLALENVALKEEKKVMTDTIFGLTQKVQDLQTREDAAKALLEATPVLERFGVVISPSEADQS